MKQYAIKNPADIDKLRRQSGVLLSSVIRPEQLPILINLNLFEDNIVELPDWSIGTYVVILSGRWAGSMGILTKRVTKIMWSIDRVPDYIRFNDLREATPEEIEKYEKSMLTALEQSMYSAC